MQCTARLIVSLLLTFFAVSAAADDFYDWPSNEAPILVHNSSGILMLGKDKLMHRAYSWKQAKGKNNKSLILMDLSKNGRPEIVGVGKPTFILNQDGDPIWSHQKGCQHLTVADVAADEKMDLVCLNGRNVDVFTHDGQLIWGAKLSRAVSSCEAGDINGDLKNDLECSYRGSKRVMRFDGSTGDVLAESSDSKEVQPTATLGMEPLGEETLTEIRYFDIDGDSVAEESVYVDGKSLAIRSKSKKVPLGIIEAKTSPTAILVKDLDGDKKLEIVAFANKQLTIASADGKDVATFKTNVKKYKREAIVEIKSIYATGFEDDESAKSTAAGLKDKLAKCYAKQVKRKKFSGTGQVLMEIQTNASGKVAKSSKLHKNEAIPDAVISCISKTFKKTKFAKAAESGGTINLMLQYTYKDR